MTEALCVKPDCDGVVVSQGCCVGHLDEQALTAYVAQLGPDGTLDARSARIDEGRCAELARFFDGARFRGTANFRDAKFLGGADFRGAQFIDPVDFARAQFTGTADFRGAKFASHALFQRAQFSGDAYFGSTEFDAIGANFRETKFAGYADFTVRQFAGLAEFTDAEFNVADFRGAEFVGYADLARAKFTGHANFHRAKFRYIADFRGVQFSRSCLLGPLRADLLNFAGAVFEGPAEINVACSTIKVTDIRARDSFTLTGRGCDIHATGARFDKPARIGSSPTVSFPGPAGENDEKAPRLVSFYGADLSNVTLAGLDLRACRFGGAYNLDRLRINGPAYLGEIPAGWWARRRTLVEEHLWRAEYDRRPNGWLPLEYQLPDDQSPEHNRSFSTTAEAGAKAEGVQAAYRELRKSFEDAKNEPGAADLYFGEMEMRRMASRADPPHRFENALLTAYWAISGYGLRASRALLALLLALAVATVLFATVGFGHSEKAAFVVPVPPTRADNQPVAYTQISVPDGKPGVSDATYYSIQSATSLLREPTSEPLTTIGRITEITLRLLGPLLLGLAVLALRGRVKR